MQKKFLKNIALAMTAAMVVGTFAGCGNSAKNSDNVTTGAANATESASKGGDSNTLVVAHDTFSSKFSPFFAQTQDDMDVATMTSATLLDIDRTGNVIKKGIEGEKVAYNGKDYTYKGIADLAVTQNDDGTVDYDVTLKDGLKFSDGEPLTIDDVIFSMYVFSDPTYDGSSSFYALPIKGMEDYRNGMEPLYKLILEKGRDNTDFTNYTQDQQTAFWAAMDKAGEEFAGDIVDYCKKNYADSADKVKNSDVALGMYAWGFGTPSDDGSQITGAETGTVYDTASVTLADYWKELQAKYKGDYDSLSSTEKANTDLYTFLWKELGKDSSKFQTGVNTGDSAPNISGIQKTGDNTLRISMTKFDATAIYNLGVMVAPLHYYGSKADYDYANNKFGFTKGDLSSMRAKISKPLGAGPYVFQDYSNGAVSFKANTNYYDGTPKIAKVLFKETSEADKLSGVKSGAFDIANPSLSTAVMDSIKKDNSNGKISGNSITTSLVDNLGYGYLGINAKNVKVGDDQSSDQSKDLRKGFQTLFASYRDTVIKSYYGEMASVIQYPISNTSWAAPTPTDDGYSIAYSKDVDGNDIYTSGMTEQQKYDAALKATEGFLKAAGYTWDDAQGKFTAAPAGADMTYEIIIPGGGNGDHPAYGILTATKEALAKIGITLQINDPSDGNVLWNAINAGTNQMWVAAWQATADPDMYQVYHSDNVVEKTGTKSNNYHIQDSQLDDLIMQARNSADQNFRKTTYKECLGIILDWGVELPLYQRKNAIIFSTKRVDMDTVTPDITPFYGWMAEIQNMKLK